MKYFKILFILLILQSCNTATLSDKEANTISNLQVKIVIEDGFKEKSLHKINAYLSNGEKKIDNKNIKILLNGKPLELFVRTGNYYDKHPVYATDDLTRSESYYFEIILPDSSKHPLAFIKPVQRINSATSQIPNKNSSSIEKGLTNPALLTNSEVLYRYVLEETED